MSEIRIEPYDPENMAHRHGIHLLFDRQAHEILAQIEVAFPRQVGVKARLVEGPVTQKVKLEREAAQRIIDRAIRSKQSRNAFAHVAICSNGKEPNQVVGYIISHQVLEDPIRQHVKALRRRFHELQSMSDEQFRRAVLSGEHAYLLPEHRGERIGTRMFDVHEAEARRRGYRIRASQLQANSNGAATFLQRRGYRIVARRKGGVCIVAKPLG